MKPQLDERAAYKAMLAPPPGHQPHFSLATPWQRARAWLHAFFAEHNFTNLLRFNFHRLSPEAFRSSQPTMWQLRREVKRHGIKTIVSLKGTNPASAYYLFERETCAKLGIQMVDAEVYSRAIPSTQSLKTAKMIFEQAEYPIWIHCKAGADRAGIYSTLYRHFRLGEPLAQIDQLKFWPYGHIRNSKAGISDFFFAAYVAYEKEHPGVGLIEWSETVVDREQMARDFQVKGLATFVNDVVLRRE